MGALVTLEVPEDSPVLAMPWIITFGPLTDDDEWEPVVCGPYERPHALALAEAVVADEELMAVVEPLLPYVTVDEIRGEIVAAKAAAAEEEEAEEEAADLYGDYADLGLDRDLEDEEVEAVSAPVTPPSADELRAGFARIAAKLTSQSG